MPRDTHAELWTPAQRQKANLAAMKLAAELARQPRTLTDDDRRALEAYSGWGGLSIKAMADKFPAGFPVPEERGLIHEYYTPSVVCAEVARVVQPLLSDLGDADGHVAALEPSAGIGRFIRAFEGPGFEGIRWHAVEYSALSAAMLEALRPDLDLFRGSFERWVADNDAHLGEMLSLVVANPPYGKRGASIAEDPNRDYRLKDAYAYFLRRGLDMLEPGGLGVFLIPSGFLTGTAKKHRDLRAAVLRRHHLSAAYRLPSGIFPGANLVTDLLFFRARGGELAAVDEADQFILEGGYFREHPEAILGKEVGNAGDDDDQTALPRWGYQVIGEFTALPDLVERPMCSTCVVVPRERRRPAKVTKAANDVEAGDPRLTLASSLGQRVHAYLALVAAQETDPALVWEELHRALVDWTNQSEAPPSLDVELVKLAKAGDAGAQRFLAAFEPRSSKIIPALRNKPAWSPRYQGRPGDVVARAEFLYRQHRSLSRKDLGDVDLSPLFQAGWCEDTPGELVPAEVYYTGHLWPRYDRAKARGDRGDAQAASQARKLLEHIAPAMFDEIDVSLRGGWVPLELVEQWIGEVLNFGRNIRLERDGLVQARNGDYEDLDRDGGQGLSADAVWAIGYINHDKTLFSPRKRKDEDIDKVRLAKADEWEKAFRAWCGADEARREQIELAYRRQFQGYLAPSYASEPLPLARWTSSGPKLHPYQAAGARRVLANRGGLIAYDVGLGKTFTGCAVIAAARQEGWCKRPVIIVPNSIVWKWVRDFANVLPDYRVAVIGSKRKTIQHGPRKGYATSETDSPA